MKKPILQTDPSVIHSEDKLETQDVAKVTTRKPRG